MSGKVYACVDGSKASPEFRHLVFLRDAPCLCRYAVTFNSYTEIGSQL